MYVTICLSLTDFKIHSLSLKLGILIVMCLGVVFFLFILIGILYALVFAWVFLSPGYGIFLSLFFQTGVLSLAVGGL